MRRSAKPQIPSYRPETFYCTAGTASSRPFQRTQDRLQRTTSSWPLPPRTRVGVGCGGSRVGWGWGCCCCAGGPRWCREAPGGRWRASAGLGPPQGPSGAALNRLSARAGCASRRPSVLPSPGQQQQRLVGVTTAAAAVTGRCGSSAAAICARWLRRLGAQRPRCLRGTADSVGAIGGSSRLGGPAGRPRAWAARIAGAGNSREIAASEGARGRRRAGRWQGAP